MDSARCLQKLSWSRSLSGEAGAPTKLSRGWPIDEENLHKRNKALTFATKRSIRDAADEMSFSTVLMKSVNKNKGAPWYLVKPSRNTAQHFLHYMSFQSKFIS